jgi:glycerophosphoryl diester phosphodiesterase
MLVIAHRGANREAVENSFAAFEAAVDGGAVRIELDVQLSQDGHAVINHDDQLERTTGRYGLISEMTRAELERWRLVNGEPVPFLDQVVERFLPRIELNIEIKGASEVLAEVVCDIVDGHERRDAVLVSCFNWEPLVWIYRHRSHIRRACLWSYADTFSWPHFANLAPQVFLDRCGTNVLHPYTELVTPNLMDQAAARGWRVYAWAALAGEERDREGLWASLKTMGLHGLCTNYPRQLKRWLEDAALDEQVYLRGLEQSGLSGGTRA